MTVVTLPAETAAFLASSGIPHTLPNSPDFAAAHDTAPLPRQGSGPSAPVAVARARNVADIEALVAHCSSAGTPFSVRNGGHDMFRRGIVPGTLNIDLRALDAISVAEDRKTARVAGGVLSQSLLAVLEPMGLTTPVGNCATVGYTGWATLGGYGNEARLFGLGVDQIVGARVVGPDGKARDVHGDVLRGIKGAGGNFGIIVEVTTKVYPMSEILATTVTFQPTTNGASSVVSMLTALERLRSGPPGSFPDKLFITPQAFSTPQGPLPMCSVIWHGSPDSPADLAEAKAWVARVATWADLATPTVPDPLPTTVGKIALATTAALPPHVAGGSGTASAAHLTPDVLELVAGAMASFPSAQGNAGGMFFHLLPPGSPSAADASDGEKEKKLRESSVFRSRVPHVMMELLPLGLTAEAAETGEPWAAEWSRKITEADGGLLAQYVPLTPPEVFDLEKEYGVEEAAWLKRVKAEVDPKGVFANALPKIV